MEGECPLSLNLEGDTLFIFSRDRATNFFLDFYKQEPYSIIAFDCSLKSSVRPYEGLYRAKNTESIEDDLCVDRWQQQVSMLLLTLA